MPTTTRPVARKTAEKPKAPPPPSHRSVDVLGIVIVAVGLVLFIGLAVGRAGVLGDGLQAIFRNLFGRAAWVFPLALTLLGGGLIMGGKRFEIGRMSWGITLIATAVVGGLAQTRQGDFFDPDTVAASGGYLGAIVGWACNELLGRGWWVGIAVLAIVGLVLCIDHPLRDLLRAVSPLRRPSPAAVAAPRGIEGDESVPDKSRSVRRSALRQALVNARAASDDEPRPDPKATQAPPRTRTAPTVRETRSMETVTLETTTKEGYELPPTTLLSSPGERSKRSPDEMQRNIATLERTLEEFGIDSNVVEIATGPTITRYEVQLGPGIRVGRISALADNIAMSLAASHVRVEAPIPGKNAIGVEVPNTKAAMVTLRELCEQKEFVDEPRRLIVGLGQDVSGRPKFADLTKMPHLLIGGATNSGKSIGLATIITSLLMRNTPKDVRMVMIDPKRVELSLFDGIPHLMCPVVKDVKEAPGVLRAVWREMDIRYDLMSERGVRNIDGWNEKATFAEKLPYIVVVIDELADLMIQAAAEVETSIVRLAQLARAVGIHLVIATQRPSVDVITGLIKANIPSRMAFAVSSHIDSRTILDQAGAEKLVGKGDMLFLPIDATKPTRIQGCYVSEIEIEQVCKHWKAQEKPHYVLNPIAVAIADKEAEMADQESEPLWEESVRWVVERGQASTSMLQRKFSIGFQRASRLLDAMEERGIVGPRDGPRPREVLVDPMDVESIFGRNTYSGPDLSGMDLEEE